MAALTTFDVQLGAYGGQEGASLWWTGRALDEDDAVDIARGDLGRAWTVVSTLRGTNAPLPPELARMACCNDIAGRITPSVRLHKGFWDAVPSQSRPVAVSEDEVRTAVNAALRLALTRAMPEGKDRYAAIYYPLKADDALRRLCCYASGAQGEIVLPEPVRAVLVAAAVAADESGFAEKRASGHVDVPASATLRATLRRSLLGTAARDLASATGLLRKLGLEADAIALEAEWSGQPAA